MTRDLSRVAGAAAVLLVYRVAALAGHRLDWSLWSPVAYLWQDVAIVAAYGAVDRALRRTPRGAWMAYAVFVLYVAGSIPVTRVMSTPMTVTMWHAAGGALGDSIRYYLTTANAAWIGGAVGMAFVPYVVSGFSRTQAEDPPAKGPPEGGHYVLSALFAFALAIVAAGPATAARVDTRGLERNPWSALAGSAMPHRFGRGSPAMPPPVARVDQSANSRGLSQFRGVAARRHVVLIGLESTAAQYLGLYGASPDVMPNVSALARSAVVFDHAYAVYPESIKGLLSVLCSAAPAFNRPAATYAGARLPSVAWTLRQHGYRTALFHSGRFDYLGMDAVVRGRGFDVLADAGDIGGNHESSFGVDDRSTVAKLLEWADRVPRSERFFVTYLPTSGHHPYETPEAGPFSERDEFGRYRNALHYSDAAIGDLIRGLDARGLTAETMFVVYGDHGEAFGQHDGNFGHTFQLWEENVHVPLFIALPGAIPAGVRVAGVASLIDIAPTILDLLALPVEPEFEGRSLLEARPRIARFFTDYSLRLVGLRDGRMKYIREIDSGRSHLFDLEQDPDELHDIGADRDRDRGRYSDVVQAWLGY